MQRPYFSKVMAEVLGIEISDDYHVEDIELPGLLPRRKFTTSEKTKKVLLNALKKKY